MLEIMKKYLVIFFIVLVVGFIAGVLVPDSAPYRLVILAFITAVSAGVSISFMKNRS